MKEITTNNEHRLYTRAEAAELLSISKKTLIDLLREGKIGVLLINNQIYVPHESLSKFIQQNTVYLNTNLKGDEDEIDLAKVRKPKNTSSFDSREYLNNLIGKPDGKYIS